MGQRRAGRRLQGSEKGPTGERSRTRGHTCKTVHLPVLPAKTGNGTFIYGVLSSGSRGKAVRSKSRAGRVECKQSTKGEAIDVLAREGHASREQRRNQRRGRGCGLGAWDRVGRRAT